jgi:hypothetical protein
MLAHERSHFAFETEEKVCVPHAESYKTAGALVDPALGAFAT